MSGSEQGEGGQKSVTGELEDRPLSVVLDDLETYASIFRSSDTLADVCEEALRKTWKDKNSKITEWKITDRGGRELLPLAKLRESAIPPQDTIYMSKVIADPKEDRFLVRAEDKVERHLVLLNRVEMNRRSLQL